MKKILALFIFGFLLNYFLSCTEQKMRKISVVTYKDKVYASLLAQCIGNIYGLPHENQYIDQPGPEEFPYGYRGGPLELMKEVKGVFSDDDTDIEYMYLLAMEKYGIEPTYAQLSDSWKYHVRDRVWLANRAALAAMQFGYTPPFTGFKIYNPHWFQIDPQLVNEIWAVTAPGMIKYAGQKSAWAARITNDSWGIEPTIHYAAMYSAAFYESDIKKLIDIGTAALPPANRFARTVEDMKALYQKYPGEWRAARQELAEKYYHQEPEDTKTIWNANLNGACGILALLYGQGEFQKTLDLACAMGFDADNQAATMSGLLGVVYGTKGLPKSLLFPFPELNWEEPFNDSYKNVSRYDMPDGSLKDMAKRMSILGERILLDQGSKKITDNGKDYYLINQDAEFIAPLELPSVTLPQFEVGKESKYDFIVSGGKPPFNWQIVDGLLPQGLSFGQGHLSGKPERSGVYPIIMKISDENEKSQRKFNLIVRDTNLAPLASEVLSNVSVINTKVRDAMWLTVGRSLYATNVEIIRDGNLTGEGSTFYSITDNPEPKIDYYGYRWEKTQEIGLLDFFTGAVEENGGWFSSLDVEYLNKEGKWKSVDELVITPTLVSGKGPHNKPHFVEYLIGFKPVQTIAIRIIGAAGGSNHWYSKPAFFSSIAELGVYGNLPNFQLLLE